MTRALASLPVRASLWSLAAVALLRATPAGTALTMIVRTLQSAIDSGLGVATSAAVIVDSRCTGADGIALALGVVLAQRTAWTHRLAGSAGALLLVLAVNTTRVVTLGAAASRPELFAILHEQIWPAVLVIAIAGYTWLWLRGFGSAPWMRSRGAAFGIAACVLLMLQFAGFPLISKSDAARRVCEWTAAAAALVMSAAGASASADGAVLSTSRGAFVVTPECVWTPLIALYAAAIVTVPLTIARRAMALAAMLPLFFALSIARALVTALPAAIAPDPLTAIHAFFQIACAVALVIVTAARSTSITRGVAAAALGAAVAWATALVASLGLAFADAVPDPQGARALMPPIAIALTVALFVAAGSRRWRRLVLATVLAVLAAAGLEQIRISPHPLFWRALSLAIPAGLAAWLFRGERTAASYRSFWDEVGEQFPDLGGAASTALYRRNEIALISDAIPSLDGCRLLKTDLWDEARNTRILQWTAERGAIVTGIDLAAATARAARAAFGPLDARVTVADVRRLPFADASFDAVYSMGTVEHFDETEDAVRELARVLRPGGRLILGVPNRFDPFLRPLMVRALHAFGLYGYGFEKSYSRRQLRAMIERAGLLVTAESGLLFIPGWLRMAELAAHTRGWRVRSALIAPAVAAFIWIDERFPRLRRHGYLLASIAAKPHTRSALTCRP